MHMQESAVATWQLEKLLCRVWIPGRGCSYFRTPAMTDREAHAVIQALSNAAAQRGKAAPGKSVTRLMLVIDTSRRAVYWQPFEMPDPDNPARSVVHFWVWIPDAEGASAEEATKLFSQCSFPENDVHARSLGLENVGPSGTPSIKQASRNAPRGRRWAIWTVVVGLCLIVALGAWGFPRWHLPERVLRSHDHEHQPPTETHLQQNRDRPFWSSLAVKDKIVTRLKATGKDDVDALTDRELLEEFFELFQRPDLDALLTKDQQEAWNMYQTARKPGFEHPFPAFLEQLPEFESVRSHAKHQPYPFIAYVEQLPENPETLTNSGDSPEVRTGEDYLRSFALQVKREGTPIDESAVSPDTPPEKLVQELLKLLDYPTFYKRWQEKHPKFPSDDEWCNSVKWPGASEWQEPVRALLKQRYNP